MDKIATENLFLIEFLVDKINLCSSPVCGPGAITCVTVQFLDNDPLDICEDDFGPKGQCPENSDSRKSGKSCLFSLTPQQAENAVFTFEVRVDINQKVQGSSNKNPAGNSLISLAALFSDLVKEVSADDKSNAPVAKTLKDTFPITNAEGNNVGQLGMYIRMSCFGKLIVTQFQMNLEDKSVLFKDKEGHSLYKYKKVGSGGGNDGCGSGGGKSNPNCPTVSCSPAGPPQPRMLPKFGGPCSNDCSMSSVDPPGCYEEIAASMGGNAVKIRVHKDNKIEQIYNDNDSAGGGGGGCACSPGNVGGKKPKMDSRNNGPPYSFKMGGCGAAAQSNVVVTPPMHTAPDGTQYTELSDPNKDVFILRIGKKSEDPDRKSNLELELCTPKREDPKVGPKTENRDSQCEGSGSPHGGAGNGRNNDGNGAGKHGKTDKHGKSGKGPKSGSGDRTIDGVVHFMGEKKPKICRPASAPEEDNLECFLCHPVCPLYESPCRPCTPVTPCTTLTSCPTLASTCPTVASTCDNQMSTSTVCVWNTPSTDLYYYPGCFKPCQPGCRYWC